MHFIYLILTIIPFIINFKYEFFNNKKFPFDFGDANTDNGETDQENKQKVCLVQTLGDGNCDEQNNNGDCEYDKGDCCADSCIKNCEAKKEKGNPCEWACGTNPYNCFKTITCESCSSNGKCVDMSKCMISSLEESNNKYAKVIQNIDACNINATSFGTSVTIDSYCGRDPHKNITHFPSDPSLHFPGCGVSKEFCTKLPCCDVVKTNSHNITNCDNTEKNMDVYDDAVKSYITKFEKCLEYYYTCFLENQRFRGQCCECNEGWAGRNCSIPLCRKPCLNGWCSDKDKCTCYEGYYGEVCELPKCADPCINGICAKTNYCECYYGWRGADCSISIRHPFCVNGNPVKTQIDKCECSPSWEGALCEIRKCPSCEEKGICNDDGTCVCNFGYRSSEPDNFNICDEFISCEIITENCYTCEQGKICLSCKKGFYLEDSKNDEDKDIQTCKSCENIHDNCLECIGSTISPTGAIIQSKCTLCEYPFELINNTCDLKGIFEFSSKFYLAVETDFELSVSLNRYYGLQGEVYAYLSVMHVENKINPNSLTTSNILFDFNNNPLNYLGFKNEELRYSISEETEKITLSVFPDLRLINTRRYYKIYVSYLLNQGVKGELTESYIEVFDDPTLIGIDYIKISLESIIKINRQLYSTYGNNKKIDIFFQSFYKDGTIKLDKIDIFLIIWFSHGNVIESINIANYVSSNIYQLTKNLQGLTKFFRIITKTCLRGRVFLEHFNSIEFNNPFFVRHSHTIEISSYFNNKTYFSRRLTFYLRNENLLIVNTYKVHFYFKYEDYFKLFINRSLHSDFKGTVLESKFCGILISCFRVSYDIIFSINEEFKELIFEFTHLEGKSEFNISLERFTGTPNVMISLNSAFFVLSCEKLTHPLNEFFLEIY